MKPESSVIIVSFNTKKTTLECISSIYKFSKKLNPEIILIDNASTDNSVSSVRKNFPDVKVIENKKNRGFGYANNQGAKLARGEYLLFLNSDTYFIEDSLGKILKWVRSSPQADIIGCRILNSDKTIQYSIGFLPNLLNIFAWMFFLDDIPFINLFFPAFYLEHPIWYSKSRQIGWIMGAFMFTKKETFKKIKGFDERMFMYGEEVEMQYRAKKLGLNCFFTPVTEIVHLGGQSSQKVSSFYAQKEGLKGVLYIFKKHFPAWEQTIARIIIKAGVVLRFFLFDLILKPANKPKYGEIYNQI